MVRCKAAAGDLRLSHLTDDGSCEGVGPSGSFALAGGGHPGAGLIEQVEGEAAEDGEVLGSVVAAVSGAVLVEGDVEHPVQRVLNRPVAADGAGEVLGREGR